MKTETGLVVSALLLERLYPTNLRASKEDWATLSIVYHKTCPRWNYTTTPARRVNA
jgi:hypothetical protein